MDEYGAFQNMAHHFPRQLVQWTHPFLVGKKSHFNKNINLTFVGTFAA